MEDLLKDPESLWLMIGAVLLTLEVTLIPGIGMFFAGLGALTFGALLVFEVIEPGSIWIQIAWFFAFTTIWTIILWKPFMRWIHKTKDNYDGLIGQRVTVSGSKLEPGKIGKVKWSGTNMKAVLSSDVEKTFEKGDILWIIAHEGITLEVSDKDLDTNTENTESK